MVVVMAMAMAECVCMYILCTYLFFHVSGITELFFMVTFVCSLFTTAIPFS